MRQIPEYCGGSWVRRHCVGKRYLGCVGSVVFGKRHHRYHNLYIYDYVYINYIRRIFAPIPLQLAYEYYDAQEYKIETSILESLRIRILHEAEILGRRTYIFYKPTTNYTSFTKLLQHIHLRHQQNGLSLLQTPL
jgi:hypothetical protein